jgi:hypothetical protein
MIVKFENIGSQVRSLEEELKALKTLVEHAPKDKKGTKTFASLKGIWKGKVHFTMNEINCTTTRGGGLNRLIKEAEIKTKEF